MERTGHLGVSATLLVDLITQSVTRIMAGPTVAYSEINMRIRRAAFAALVAGSLIVAGALPASAGGHAGGKPDGPTVIASGLNNPRQLSFAPNGDLYVAEAGAGGSQALYGGPGRRHRLLR